MDAGSIWVVAGYSGWVTTVVDGNYDRCHTHLGTVTCDGHPIEPNYIVIEHPDGVRSEYFHLMKDSIVVEEGQEVQCGDLLGRVGSSGNSSMPHLHFQVEIEGEWIDPYAGPFSQAESLWELQGNDFSLPELGCTAR
jgi:murein DD-endopeptidase MepM/ murein hydrolase activator NlpD